MRRSTVYVTLLRPWAMKVRTSNLKMSQGHSPSSMKFKWPLSVILQRIRRRTAAARSCAPARPFRGSEYGIRPARSLWRSTTAATACPLNRILRFGPSTTGSPEPSCSRRFTHVQFLFPAAAARGSRRGEPALQRLGSIPPEGLACFDPVALHPVATVLIRAPVLFNRGPRTGVVLIACDKDPIDPQLPGNRQGIHECLSGVAPAAG